MVGNLSVCAIVVTYHPKPDLLGRLLCVTAEQVTTVVVVDNGSNEEELDRMRDLVAQVESKNCFLLELGENLGIAAAQNRGITWAQQLGSSQVLFLDQDSIPCVGMVSSLQAALVGLAAQGRRVAAVGPHLVDNRTGKSSPFVKIHWFGVVRSGCGGSSPSVQATDFLVSSGMLVPLEIFDWVGVLEEELFIDNVDLEWCFRARSLGYVLYGVCDAVMQHSIGDQIFRFGSATIHRHAPLRQYYIMRNRLLLYGRKYAPTSWVLQDALRSVFKVLVFSLVMPPRRENIRMMYRGVRDALVKRLGRYRD